MIAIKPFQQDTSARSTETTLTLVAYVKNPKRRIVNICLWGILVLATAILTLPSLFVRLATANRSHNVIADVAARPVAIVFGAGVTSKGILTPPLKARVDTGIALFQAGKVKTLLMTGDDAHVFHNEPYAMRRYAIHHGVPASAIACDFAGFRTYDSCYRARAIFGVKSAILVTQAYHIPRALFTAQMLGLNVTGCDAPNPCNLSCRIRMCVRENAATLLSFIDLARHRRPKFLGPPVAL